MPAKQPPTYNVSVPSFSVGELSWTDVEDEARAWLTGSDSEPVLNFNMWRGPQGDAAGFGEVTAEVGDGAGVPTVEVSTSGDDRELVIHFAFDNLRADFGTPQVSVGDGVGDPTATVSATGPWYAKVFSFAFDNLRADIAQPTAEIDDLSGGTPTVEVTSSGPWNAKVFHFKFSNLRGAGVPEGGTAGQVLVKDGPDDYDTAWADASDLITLDPSKVVVTDSDGHLATSDVDAGELGALDGVDTSKTIQQQINEINAKFEDIDVQITGAASTIKDDNLTPNRVAISNADGKVAVSEVTTEELGMLDGIGTSQTIEQRFGTIEAWEGTVNASITKLTQDSAAALAAIKAILNKVAGGGTLDEGTGAVTWGMSGSIPVGNINVLANVSDPASGTSSGYIKTHAGAATDRDVWFKTGA